MRTTTPRWWHWSTSSTASRSGNSGSAMITSSTRWATTMSPMSFRVPSEISPLSGRGASDTKPMTLMWSPPPRAQRVRHVLDVLAGAHEHRPALVARRAQQPPGRALVGEAERRHVGDGEEQRAVEDVVAGEVPAADDPVERHHHRDLEERGDDARQPRAHGAVAVEPGLGEQQRRDEEGERHVVLGLVEATDGSQRVARGRLEPQGGDDGQEDRGEVERQQRHGARDAAQRVHAQQERERRRALAAHVALGAAAAARAAATTRAASGTSVVPRVGISRLLTADRDGCRAIAHERASYRPAPTSMSTPAWSIVRRRPSCSDTLGSQPEQLARARDVGLAHLRVVHRAAPRRRSPSSSRSPR